MEETPITEVRRYIGDEVRTLGDGRIGGYLVRYNTADTPDLYGTWFTASTDYGPHNGDGMYCLVHHGIPVRAELAHLADTLLTPIRTKQDDIGIWAETILNMADEYQRMIYEMVEAGKLSWSSGTASHLARIADNGEVLRWPIIEGSLTPMPAGFGTRAVPVRAAELPLPSTEEGEEKMEEETSTPVVTPTEPAATPAPPQQDYGAEIRALANQQQQTSAQITQLLQYIQDAPAIRNAPYVTPDGGTADPGVRSFGDFCTAVARDDRKRLRSIYNIRAQEESAGASGGYLVPTEFVPMIMQLATEASVVRPLARIQPMSTNMLQMPAPDYSLGYSAGNSAFNAGVQMEWYDESQTITDTEVQFRQIELHARKMGRAIPVSSELAEDAPGLEALLLRYFAQAIAYTEDYTFLRGDGVGKPLGVLNAPCTIIASSALSNPPTVAQLSQIYSRLMTQCRGTAVWVINPLLINQLVDINAAAGSTNLLTWLPNLRNQMEMRLLGKPVIESDKLPTTFAAGGLLLADFQQYIIGDRRQIQVAYSEHVNFDTDQVKWRVTHRVDGQPWMNAAVAIGSGDSDTVSCFVISK